MGIRRHRTVVLAGLAATLTFAAPAHALIGTSGIANLAITTPKLANSAVTTLKLANSAVTTLKLGNNAVTAAKLAADAVTAPKVAFYRNVVVVAPTGGDYTSPEAALNAITDAGESNPYLVKIMPGVYDIGGGTVQMKPYVDIEGSGQGVTIITGTVSTPANPADPTDVRPLYGVVTGSDAAELRFLTVANVSQAGAPVFVTAIKAANCNLRVTHVTAIAAGNNLNAGIMIGRTAGGDMVELNDVRAAAQGGAMNMGIAIRGFTGAADVSEVRLAVLKNAWGFGQDGSTLNEGIFIRDASPYVLDCVAVASGTKAMGIEVNGGSPEIIGSHVDGGLLVRYNGANASAARFFNSALATGDAAVDDGKLDVANSSLPAPVGLANAAVARCAAAVRHDDLTLLDAGCQTPAP